MPVAILEKLPEEEAQAFIAHAARRHPAIALTARAREDGKMFDVVADESDATDYADVIEAIIRSRTPMPFSIASTERRIAGWLREALLDGSIARATHQETPALPFGVALLNF